jgi:FimV-like protein
MVFLLRWIKAIFYSMPIVPAIIMSYSYSVLAADSPLDELDNGPEVISLSTIEPASNPSMPTHTVVVGDTLWNVTFRLRPEGMPMAQAMDTLYENNPEAFLEGDSTKLIEGSVVSFVSSRLVNEPTEDVIIKENSTLIIPTMDVFKDGSDTLNASPEDVEDISIDLEASPKILDDSILEVPKDDQSTQFLPDVLPLIEAEKHVESVESVESLEAQVPVNKPVSVINQPDDQAKVFIEQLKTLASKFDSKSFFQVLLKVKQLPVDFWIFMGALLFAMIINRSRKLNSINKVKEDGVTSPDKPIETVLDGPFAESADDDVFANVVEQSPQQKPTVKDSGTDVKEAIKLPGIEALEAQFQEDANEKQSPVGQLIDVDFEDESMDIDPLQIKLDMASLCIEMGDIESAQAILEEIIGEADKQGKAKAREILDSIET